ncbi:unnamed protein product [Adineta ricciae]|uniref:Uncharacterized protein n=1 Tax=Adineta ricciae TaxID=249248 RepID=A0A815Q9K9_ADIRI|nr:unnamed protein product [Adineta ricciae]
MNDSKSDTKRKNIWSRILLQQYVDGVASLGDRVDKLEKEGWRLHDKTRLNSLWAEGELIKIQATAIKVLLPESSLPLVQPPLTRAHEKNEDNIEIHGENSFIGQISIVFSTTEWKDAFSRTHQKMKADWTTTFNKKLTNNGTGITCTLKFKTPYFKTGERKKNCRDFSCTITCTIKGCKRKYIMECEFLPDDNPSVLFLVKIFGKQDHTNGPSTRKLNGKDRMLVGERVEVADEHLQAAGNFTGCETIETINKAAYDYRKKMHIAENIYAECRITEFVFDVADETSQDCKDATGGVIKKLARQKQILVYALLFKDGDDSNDNIPLAHAMLADNRVPSISSCFKYLRYSIYQVRNVDILPSFYVIDFSAALMNAILEGFIVETINAHLKRCWNVLHGQQIRCWIRSDLTGSDHPTKSDRIPGNGIALESD